MNYVLTSYIRNSHNTELKLHKQYARYGLCVCSCLLEVSGQNRGPHMYRLATEVFGRVDHRLNIHYK